MWPQFKFTGRNCQCTVIALILNFTAIVSFLGDFAASTTTAPSSSIRYGVLGVRTNFGQTKKGCAMGPKSLRKTQFLRALKGDSGGGVQIKDYGNVECYRQFVSIQRLSSPSQVPDSNSTTGQNGDDNGMRKQGNQKKPVVLQNVEQVAACSREVYKKVRQILEAGRFPVTIGGDHTISIGTLAATQEVYGEEMGILYIDAHGDINTAKTTITGHLHGMTLSFIIKELQGQNNLPGFEFIKSIIPAKNLVYIGTRDLDPLEVKILKDLEIRSFSMEEIRRIGFLPAVKRALNLVSSNNSRPFHVSYDIDVLDPTVAPSTGTLAPGGLTLKQGLILMEQIRATGRMIAMDLAEVNPRIGTPEDVVKTLNAAKAILITAFGENVVVP